MDVPTLSPARLDEIRREGRTIDLIDVRTPAEFRELHVAYARNVPLDELDPVALRTSRRGAPADPVYVVCRTGDRGRRACERLRRDGGLDAVNVEGGTAACAVAGLPVVRGRKAVSLERQVRIAAGSLTLLGAALAWFVHPAFTALPAFVGAGLIFAGITDTCGMAMLLARLPWNRRGGCGGCADSEDPS